MMLDPSEMAGFLILGNFAPDQKFGCGKLIPVDPSDKNSEGWTCGQYYDSFKTEFICVTLR